MAGPWEKYAQSSSKPWEKYTVSESKKPLPDAGSLSEGMKLRLEKQLIGAQEIGSDIGRMFSGEMGQPYSPYREFVQKRGEELTKQGEKAPLLTKAGDVGMMMLENLAIPGAPSAAGRIGINALMGGGMAGLNPYATPMERAQSTAAGALSGAVLPEVVGPAAKGLTGMARYGRGIINPQYGALREIARETGGATLPTEVSSVYGNAPPPGQAGPTLPPFGRAEGVRPTVGMITDDPRLLELEMNARNRAPADFMQRDIENQQAIIAGLEKRALSDEQERLAMEKLNEETGALRSGAFEQARKSPSVFEMTAPLTEIMSEMKVRPGEVGRASLPLQSTIKATERSALGGPEGAGYTSGPDPSDLYAARKQIDDALRGMAGPNDELANAIKSNRKGAMELKAAIDEGLSAASQGEWDKYLKTYIEKIKPIEEGRAFRDVLDMFKNAPVLPGTTIRSITPAKMRKAASDITTKEMGTSEIDRLTPSGRGFLEDAAMAMSALENAQKGARATSGSPTATYLTSLMKSGLVPGGGKTATILNMVDALGRSRGATALDEALRNPEQFQQLLNAYHAGQAPTGISKMLERTSANVPEYLKRRFR